MCVRVCNIFSKIQNHIYFSSNPRRSFPFGPISARTSSPVGSAENAENGTIEIFKFGLILDLMPRDTSPNYYLFLFLFSVASEVNRFTGQKYVLPSRCIEKLNISPESVGKNFTYQIRTMRITEEHGRVQQKKKHSGSFEKVWTRG